ncbi:MAG: hypothetical protein K1564_18695 [Candidatus Thiodiazotropha sp. (ex. Lucinisca nassula)]|nr:hypothetical protein [Candidatus Thiodiazotropha sp. (ex. Lucinisca nassula)]
MTKKINTRVMPRFDFDIFRLNLDGQMGGVLLSAEWRWFQYMNAVHHA